MLRESWTEEPFHWRYILAEDGKTPVPCDDRWQFILWMAAHEHERHVGDVTLVKGTERVRVSTIFLGHQMGMTLVPLVFETLLERPQAEVHDRYATWDEAAAGHDKWVKFYEAEGYETTE